jgi:antitoxin (DNA-binding transcriptional repressor) of toxin-antitoxin stability system
MKHVSIKEAKDRLTVLARQVEKGARITITRNGQPVMDWVPHQTKKGLDFEALRRWKAEKGYVRVAGPVPSDFDDPLPEDFLIRPTR